MSSEDEETRPRHDHVIELRPGQPIEVEPGQTVEVTIDIGEAVKLFFLRILITFLLLLLVFILGVTILHQYKQI